MAMSKLLLMAPLFLLLLSTTRAADQQVMSLDGNSTKPGAGGITTAGAGTLDCGAACVGRCSESKRPNLCRRACGSCCTRCNCVPPGTFGNYDACPCYASLTTRGDRRKCP